MTHSIGAVCVVAVFAAALAANARRPIARVALMCAAAYGSHLLLDWLGADRYPPLGLQVLWPISKGWYISGVDLFRQTARQRVFTRGPLMVNLRAVAQEIAILGPTRRRAVVSTRKSPGRTCDRGARRRPSGAVGGTGGTSDRRSRRAAR